MEGTSPLAATSRSIRPTYEPEATRLQKDAESFTQKLEKERRLALLLDENIREVTKKFAQKQASVKQVNSLRQANARDQEQITFLETRLNRAKLELGDLQIHNRKLRSEIDSVRKCTVDGLSATKKLTGELEEVKEDAFETRKRGSQSVAHDAKNRRRILSLHESKAETQLRLSQRIGSLQREILEDRQAKKELLRRLMNAPVSAEMSESGQVTKHLYEKWVALGREKRREVDAYIRRIQDLTAGFDKMKEFSTIDDLQTVVQSFLNSLERQKEIQKHLVILSENFDELEEELTHAKEIMARVSASESSQAVVFQELQTTTEAKIEALRSAADMKSSSLNLLTREIEILQGPLKELYQICTSLDLEPTLSEKVELTETSEFNVETAGAYLVQLEELSDKLAALIEAGQKEDVSDRKVRDFSFLPKKEFYQTLDMSLVLDPDNQPKAEEEPYPLTPGEFRLRAKKALNRTSVL